MASDVAIHLQALKSSDAARRLDVAESLLSLGDAAAPAVLALIDALEDDEPQVVEAVNGALEAIATPPDTLVPELTSRLSDANAHRAYWAATLLGRMGNDAWQATDALAGIVARESVPAEVRQRAAWALGQFGPDASSAVQQLEQAAASDDARLARLAQEALQSIAGS